MSKEQMVYKKSWEEFRETGLLWWVNRILHLFGWAISFEYDEDLNIVDVYPVRCKFRGFSEKVETKNFYKLTKYIKENIDEFGEDIISEFEGGKNETTDKNSN